MGGESDESGQNARTTIREETEKEGDDMKAPLQEGELLGGLDREGVKRAVHRLDTLPIEEFPLFMQSLPSDTSGGNVPLEALQSLLYEGTPEEQAQNFKTQGNECYVLGKPGPLQDAIRFYSRGLETGCQDRTLLATLHLNRSAACLVLGRTEDAFRDAQKALSLLPPSSPSPSSLLSSNSSAGRGQEERVKVDVQEEQEKEQAATMPNGAAINDKDSACRTEDAEDRTRLLRIKVLQRILKTALLLEKAEEARSALMVLEGTNGSGGPVEPELLRKLELLEEKRAQEREAAIKEEKRLQTIRHLVKGRGITVVAGAERQLLEHLGPDVLAAVDQLPTVQLVGRGSLNSRERLAWPVLLLYPEEAQTDWLQAVDEESRLQDILETVLVPSPPWDNQDQYSPATVHIYWHDAQPSDTKREEGDRLVQLPPQARLKDLIGTLVKTIDRGILSFLICPVGASGRLINRYRRLHHWQGGGEIHSVRR